MNKEDYLQLKMKQQDFIDVSLDKDSAKRATVKYLKKEFCLPSHPYIKDGVLYNAEVMVDNTKIRKATNIDKKIVDILSIIQKKWASEEG